jgi:hypothetical protein
VIVAVTAVLMMQMIVDSVIGVVAVRHRFMAAAGAVDMRGVVTAAAVTRGAALRVFSRDFDYVLVDVSLMRVMQMTLVEVVDVPLVAHRRMAAARAVLMRMAWVLARRTAVHVFSSSLFASRKNRERHPVA